MNISEWIDKHPKAFSKISKDLKVKVNQQINFVGYFLSTVFQIEVGRYNKKVHIINSFKYQNAHLPVYLIVVRSDLHIVLLSDFNNWVVSIKSTKDLKINPRNLFNPRATIPYYWNQRIPANYRFPNYSQSQKNFTAEVSDSYTLYTLIHIIYQEF